MKKFLLTAAASILAFAAPAATLTPEEALARLNDSRLKTTGITAENLELIASGEYEGTPTYYIFSNDSRALILGADEYALPVLGYIDNPVSAETPMPSQLQWWLENYGRQIHNAVEASNSTSITSKRRTVNSKGALGLVGKKIMTNAESRKAATRAGDKSAISPLIKTYWDQSRPYNNLCPTGTYSGCVATAMAQVMNFHQYPEVGTGTVSTSYQGRSLSLNLADKAFDWDNMLNRYTGSYTTTQANAVAYLMQACGYSVGMSYSSTGSGAQSYRVATALINNFKYDQGIEYLMAEYYSTEEWSDMLYNELANNRPVLYAGSGTGGGHEFVCDGYATNGTFHFNWGWSGAYDGYFPLNGLTPEGMGAGGNEDGFNQGQDALFGVQKPVEGSTPAQATLSVYGGLLNASAYNRTVTISVSGSNYAGFANLSYLSSDFQVAYKLVPETGDTVYISEKSQKFSLSPMNIRTTSFSLRVAVAVPQGTYKLIPVYRNGTTGDWKNILIPSANPTDITLTISDEGLSVDVDVDGPLSDMLEFNDAETSTGFYAGREADLIVPITNIGSKEIDAKIGMYILNSSTLTPVSTCEPVQVKLAGKETKTFDFTCNINKGVSGSYYAALCDEEGNILVAYSVSVTEPFPATFTKYECTTGYTIGSECAIKVTLKNETYNRINGEVTCYLCTLEDNYLNDVADFGTKTVALGIYVSRVYEFGGMIPTTLTPGTHYIVFAGPEGEILYTEEVTLKADDSGIGNISETEEGAEYFNMQGHRIAMPDASGIYIKKTNKKILKVTGCR